MNCLYITLFFNIVDGIIQTFIKSWNQLFYPRVIEVFSSPLNHVMNSSCTSSSSSNFFPARCFFRWRNKWKSLVARSGLYGGWIFARRSTLALRNLWRNAPRIWRDFGTDLPFQTYLTQTKPVLLLSNKHGSQVKYQVRRQCCHNKH